MVVMYLSKLCFDSFEVEYLLKQTKNIIGGKVIIRCIYRIQVNDSILFNQRNKRRRTDEEA